MRIMTLDPSGIFGYAFGDPFDPKPPFSGIFKLPEGTVTKRLIAVEDWLADKIRANSITDVFIEQNFIPEKTSFAAVNLLAGYVSHSGTAAARLGCNVSTIELSTWRSALNLPTRGPKNIMKDSRYAEKFGKRKSGEADARRQWVKDRAMEYARKHGCEPKDDNEGDAICMYLHKRAQILERKERASQRVDLFDDLKV